jgi:hypothetical protein
MEDNRELLRAELAELYTFTRYHFQLYLGWYTFFLTVNFAAIGWFTNVLVTGALKVSVPVLFVAAFFIAQLTFSLIASIEVRKHFSATHQRCSELLASLVAQPEESTLRPATAFPIPVYSKIISLICYTLVSFVFFWITLAAVSLYLVPL